MWIASLILLMEICWVADSATGGQVLTELRRISHSSTDGRQVVVMRVRTCRDAFTVQCELSEVIRIVNASYATDRFRPINSTAGCSDVSFKVDFNCLHPTDGQYLETITRSCNKAASSDLVQREISPSCNPLSRTSSCCVEIYYTCERRKDTSVSSLFRASDSSGNTYVSLQCESSDLVVDSVLLAFNSSGEFYEGGVCYKMSPNKQHVKNQCVGKGCTDVLVSGVRGCGGDKYTFNFGVYIYYICKAGELNESLKLTTLFSAKTISNQQQNMSRQSKASAAKALLTTQSSSGAQFFSETPSSSSKQPLSATQSLSRTQSSSGTQSLSGSSGKQSFSGTLSSSGIQSSSGTQSTSGTPSLSGTTSSSRTQSSAGISYGQETSDKQTISSQVNLWVNFSTLIVGVILMSAGIGCIVYTKRNRNQSADSSCLRKVTQGQIPETNNGNRGFEELEDYSYPYLPIVCVQKDIAGTCLDNRASSSKAAPEEGEIKAQCKPSWSNEVKEQTEGVATVGEVSPGVMYENVDKANKSNHLGLKFNYSADIHPRSHLEFVDVDDMVEKYSKVVYSEQEDIRNKFKSFCVPHESSTVSANSGIYSEDMNEVYDKLNHADQNLNPVYDQLSFSSRNKNPVYDG